MAVLLFCAAFLAAVGFAQNLDSAFVGLNEQGNLLLQSPKGKDIVVDGVLFRTLLRSLEKLEQDNAKLTKRVEMLEGRSGGVTADGGVFIGDLTLIGLVDQWVLTELPALKHIGDFKIQNSNLTNVDGFGRLTSIGGHLDISSNVNLTNVDGFGRLTSIGGQLSINYNKKLNNLDGFGSLTSIRNNVQIIGNPNLINVDGFGNLTSIVGDLNVNSNLNLTNVDGFGSLTSIGNLNIYNNNNLTSLHGLGNLTSIRSGLTIELNNNLVNVDGFGSLTSIGGNLIITGNNNLINVDGFGSLTSVGSIHIVGSKLKATNCFPALKCMGGLGLSGGCTSAAESRLKALPPCV